MKPRVLERQGKAATASDCSEARSNKPLQTNNVPGIDQNRTAQTSKRTKLALDHTYTKYTLDQNLFVGYPLDATVGG